MELWKVQRGATPLIIDIPHAGTFVPEKIARRLTFAASSLPDTDWHVDQLYAFAAALGATLLAATHSRYVVDLNRDPSGESLYPGADTTELCSTRTFANDPIYRAGQEPDAGEVAERIRHYFVPYHAMLAAEIERTRLRHGYAIVLDAHSIASIVPRFFAGRLPDLSLGTADGASTVKNLEASAIDIISKATGFTWVANGRFKGGYVTRHYGRPDARIYALQLEIAQACYMDESRPHPWSASRAAALMEVLGRLTDTLLAWRSDAMST